MPLNSGVRLSRGKLMDFDEDPDAEVDRAIVIALAHRIAAMGAIRTTTLPAILLFGVLAWHLGSWFPLLILPVVVWFVSIAISISSANKVRRLTGLSHESQHILWQRYKSDPTFAAEINIAVKDPNLLG